MNKYRIAIEETLRKVVEVEAETPGLAVCKEEDEYNEEKYVLSADDFIGVDITLSSDDETVRRMVNDTDFVAYVERRFFEMSENYQLEDKIRLAFGSFDNALHEFGERQEQLDLNRPQVNLVGGSEQQVRTINFTDRLEEEFGTICHDAPNSPRAVETIGVVVPKLKALTREELHEFAVEYAFIGKRLHDAECSMLEFIRRFLKKYGRVSLVLTEEEEQDDNNFPITANLYGKHDTPLIQITDVYLTEGKYLHADGIDVNTGEKRTGFYIYREQYAYIFQFIGYISKRS